MQIWFKRACETSLPHHSPHSKSTIYAYTSLTLTPQLIMASMIPHHLTSILLLTLLLFTSKCRSSQDGQDFKNWVSWNVENYERRATLRASLDSPSSSTIDPKLAKAEAAKVSYIVSQDGSGDYKSIRDAIGSIPLKNTRRVILDIKPGIYREKVVIPKSLSFITFSGSSDSGEPTVITGNDTAATKGSDGRPTKTFHSPTVAINANYFVASNIRFENTAPYPDVGQVGGQAVALRISGDKAAFYNCSFYSNQDTLYDHKGLHYFDGCFIQGSVDFIFGYGRSLYESCFLNSVAKRVASLTAQKRTRATMESGFSFTKSTITGIGLVYLGRAWGDRSRVVFSYTFMDKVVVPEGWNNWHVHRPEKSGVYYGEYQCSGPGANWTGRVRWARLLRDREAQPFLGTYYVRGETWILGPP